MTLDHGNGLSRQERRDLRILIQKVGITRAREMLGASRGALERAIGGLGIRAGTALVLKTALAALAAPTAPEAQSETAPTVQP